MQGYRTMGPDCWYGAEGIKVWKQLLSLTGKVDYAIGDNINHVAPITREYFTLGVYVHVQCAHLWRALNGT